MKPTSSALLSGLLPARSSLLSVVEACKVVELLLALFIKRHRMSLAQLRKNHLFVMVALVSSMPSLIQISFHLRCTIIIVFRSRLELVKCWYAREHHVMLLPISISISNASKAQTCSLSITQRNCRRSPCHPDDPGLVLRVVRVLSIILEGGGRPWPRSLSLR